MKRVFKAIGRWMCRRGWHWSNGKRKAVNDWRHISTSGLGGDTAHSRLIEDHCARCGATYYWNDVMFS